MSTPRGLQIFTPPSCNIIYHKRRSIIWIGMAYNWPAANVPTNQQHAEQ